METEASFNTWTSLFLLAVVFGLFLTFKLLSSRRSLSKNWPIVLIVFGFSCILFQYVFYWSGHYLEYRFLYFYDHVWYLLFGPLLYQYVMNYYYKEFKTNWFHYLPAFILGAMTTYYFMRTGGIFHADEVTSETLHHFFIKLRSPWVAGISLLIYTFITKNFIQFARPESPSEFEKTRDRWMIHLVNLFSVFIVAYFSYFILVRFEFFNPNWDYAISLSMTASMYAIGCMVYNEPSIFNGTLFSSLFLKESRVNEFSVATQQELYADLLSHMHTNKPYLNSELRLVGLADEMGLSSHMISKLINDQSGKNFNHFINDFRLVEAERLLLENDEVFVKNIYYDVGFNSKGAFYKAFKAKNKCTPSDFKNQTLQAKGKG